MHQTLPAGIQRELDQAEARTGMTPALEKAARRIPILLRMPPSSVEAYCRLVQQAEDDKKVYETLDKQAQA